MNPTSNGLTTLGSSASGTSDRALYPMSTSPENVVLLVIGIISVVANSVLLYVMYKDPLKCFRSMMSYLIISLSSADLLTGINGTLYAILNPLHMYSIALWYCFWISVMASTFTVSTMSLERWSAILYPFKSGTIFTKRITIYICAAIWFSASAGAMSIHFSPVVMPFVLSTLMEVLLIIIVLLYIGIFRYFRQTQRQTSAIDKIAQASENVNQSSKTKPQATSKTRAKIETQLLAVVLILVMILIVTFIPYNLATQIAYGCLLFSEKPCSSVVLFRRYFFPFKFLNFLLNPFVYAWRLPQYRKAFALAFCYDTFKKTTVKVSRVSAQATMNKGCETEPGKKQKKSSTETTS